MVETLQLVYFRKKKVNLFSLSAEVWYVVEVLVHLFGELLATKCLHLVLELVPKVTSLKFQVRIQGSLITF